MLNCGCYDAAFVAAHCKCPGEGDIVAFRSAACENKLGLLRIKVGCKPCSCSVDIPLDRNGGGVCSCRVIKLLGHVSKSRVCSLGANRRCCTVIKINHINYQPVGLLSNRRMQCLKTQCQQIHVRHVRRLLNKYAVNSAFVKNAVRREFQSSTRLRFIRWGMSVHPWVRRADSEVDKVRSAHRNSASVRSYTD